MKEQGTIEIIGRQMLLAMQPLRNAVEDLESFKRFLFALGWRVDSLPPAFKQLASIIDQSMNDLIAFSDEPTLEEAFALLTSVKNIYDAIVNVNNAPTGVDSTTFLQEIAPQIFEFLFINYIQLQAPKTYYWLNTLGLIEFINFESTENRPAYSRRKFSYSNLARIIEHPTSLPEIVYGWNTSNLQFDRLIYNIADLFSFLGLHSSIENTDKSDTFGGYGSFNLFDFGNQFYLELPLASTYISEVPAVLKLGIYRFDPPTENLPGLIIEPVIPGMLQEEFSFTDNLSLSLNAGFNFEDLFGLILTPKDVEVRYPFQPSKSLPQGGVNLNLDFHPEGFFLLFGQPKATRLQLKGARYSLKVNFIDDEFHIDLETKLNELALFLNGGEGDGFISRVLGAGEKVIDIPLALSWSNKNGFHFRGGTGFEIGIASHFSFGPVELKNIRLATRAPIDDQPPYFSFQAGTELRLSLGPLKAYILNIGAQIKILFQRGNAGPIDLDIGYKPPTGIALSIDGGGFKGGGQLGFEPEQERYTGFLELTFQDSISLKAIGLLTTQLPNGQDGYSLLLVITSEFTPIQLGFGFTLNGVGGLLGLNRTMNIDRLRTGIRDNTLSSILFPQNIIANADQVISDLRQAFPPQDDRFVFGPMFKIGWGSPTIITIDLGLLIEVPSPVRLAILGVIKARLPDEEARILRLQVNFLGEIDFERKQLSFDASLYDSKLLAFSLTGDMAIRMYWGANANFLMTVGGFHPAYQPPPMNLPNILRLTLALLDGNNPRLRLETYFAVTSNTVQFGAKAELYAAAWKINVYGFISFDVLFQFSPFRFIADVSAMLALRYGNSSFASIKLAFTLEGPTPWKAKGTASFKICWFFTLKVRFNKTFGENRNTNLPAVEVLPALLEAFRNKDNWTGELPARRNQLVSFKTAEALLPEDILAHPVGVLVISQKLVPLNIEIQKFGYQKPADATEFEVENVMLESSSTDPAVAKEDFAPAQFFEYKDEEKLSLPSFKAFDSGIRIADLDKVAIDYAAAKEVKYELKYIDSIRDRRLEKAGRLHTLDPASFNSWTMQGAVAGSDLSYAKNKKPALAPQEVAITEERYGIVNASDLRLYDSNSLLANEIEARLRRDLLIAENPALSASLQVVPAFEIMD